MTLGQKIKKLRTDKGLTQKDLSDQVHVAFQTVSKWEKDENEPDVNTLRELAKLFGCSMDYLLSEDEQEQEIIEEEKAAAPAPKVKPLHICAACGLEIPEDELAVHKELKFTDDTHQDTEFRDIYYHKTCLKDKNVKQAAQTKTRSVSRVKKLAFGWGIAAGVVALGIMLAILLANNVHPGIAIGVSLVIGYAIFADLYCIICLSYIGEVFLTVSSWSIKLPGLIFTASWEGLAWLIVMKILFAIIGFFFGVFVLFLAIAISAALAAVSFPFILIHNIKTNYSDAVVIPSGHGGSHRRGGR